MGFIHQHSLLAAIAAYYIFSAAVSAMPDPAACGGKMFYTWLFHFTHVLSGDLSAYVGSRPLLR